MAGIENSSVPEFRPAPQIPIAWLATASGSYLDTAGNMLIVPYSREQTRAPRRALVTRRIREPRLPERICFLSDSGSDPGRYSATFDKAFTNAVFSALGFTNIADLDLPTGFQYEDFMPDQRAAAFGFECEGKIKAVRSACTLSNLLPRVPAGAGGLISDFRFQSKDDIQGHAFEYRPTNWVARTEVPQLPGFTDYLAWEKGVKSIPKSVPGTASTARLSTKSTQLIFVALLFVSTLLIIFLWRITSKGQTK